MISHWNHIIIGASQAGITAATVIRAQCPEENILIVNGEDRLPYKRTHLTKKMAEGFHKDDFALYPASWYEENRIKLLSGVMVEEINPVDKYIKLCDGSRHGWGKLLIATGASPAVLPIPGIKHAHHLRSASDTEKIMHDLSLSSRVIILGQGVEGVELAEQCSKAGKEVLITGMDSRLMQRTLNEDLSARLSAIFSKNGIKTNFNSAALGIQEKDNKLTLICEDGTFNADMIISSTGITPNNKLTEGLGVNGVCGIITNHCYETSVPDIYAAGDVLQLPEGWNCGLWHSAQYQGEAAGMNMAGKESIRYDYPVRTKCEVFGDFIFSMGLKKCSETDTVSGWSDDVFADAAGNYLKLFSNEGRVIAALMAGKKNRAKILQKAVEAGLLAKEIIKLMNN